MSKLTTRDKILLLLPDQEKSLSTGQICDLINISRTQVSITLNKLVKEGLVRKLLRTVEREKVFNSSQTIKIHVWKIT